MSCLLLLVVGLFVCLFVVLLVCLSACLLFADYRGLLFVASCLLFVVRWLTFGVVSVVCCVCCLIFVVC